MNQLHIKVPVAVNLQAPHGLCHSLAEEKLPVFVGQPEPPGESSALDVHGCDREFVRSGEVQLVSSIGGESWHPQRHRLETRATVWLLEALFLRMLGSVGSSALRCTVPSEHCRLSVQIVALSSIPTPLVTQPGCALVQGRDRGSE